MTWLGSGWLAGLQTAKYTASVLNNTKRAYLYAVDQERSGVAASAAAVQLLLGLLLAAIAGDVFLLLLCWLNTGNRFELTEVGFLRRRPNQHVHTSQVNTNNTQQHTACAQQHQEAQIVRGCTAKG